MHSDISGKLSSNSHACKEEDDVEAALIDEQEHADSSDITYCVQLANDDLDGVRIYCDQ